MTFSRENKVWMGAPDTDNRVTKAWKRSQSGEREWQNSGRAPGSNTDQIPSIHARFGSKEVLADGILAGEEWQSRSGDTRAIPVQTRGDPGPDGLERYR